MPADAPAACGDMGQSAAELCGGGSEPECRQLVGERWRVRDVDQPLVESRSHAVGELHTN